MEHLFFYFVTLSHSISFLGTKGSNQRSSQGYSWLEKHLLFLVYEIMVAVALIGTGAVCRLSWWRIQFCSGWGNGAVETGFCSGQ